MERNVSTKEIARILVLGERRIYQLCSAGVLVHATDEEGRELRGRFPLAASVQAYIRYLRNELEADDDTETRYLESRARRMTAMAASEELRLKKLRGELHHANDVEFCLTRMLTAFKSRLLALPSRLCGLLVGKTNQAEIAELLRREVESALHELSEYDPARFEAANEEYLAQIGAAKPCPDVDKVAVDGNGEKPA